MNVLGGFLEELDNVVGLVFGGFLEELDITVVGLVLGGFFEDPEGPAVVS